MRPSVAITIRSFDPEGGAMQELRDHAHITFWNRHGRRMKEEELRAAVQEAEGVIAGTEQFTAGVLGQAPRLKVISRVGSGTDSIDLASAQQRGIRICTTPNSVVQPVAEHTIALILSVLKGIPAYDAGMRRGDHAVKAGTLLAGKTVGIIGLGRIGFRVASLLDALGCRILFYDSFSIRDVPGTWKPAGSVEDILGQSDIVTLHAGPQADNTPLLSADRFRTARKGIVIINTARGSLIDEGAMAEALKDGTVSGAGLDVFQQEPYTGPLLAFSQVVATPHVASNTRESRGEMELEAVRNLLAALRDGTA
ncbi:MAG: hypothetical protein LUQ13_03305 [Methanomicrobiales archaeon]|nr:hypothetical protein [Methanomicrobiales archaeon]